MKTNFIVIGKLLFMVRTEDELYMVRTKKHSNVKINPNLLKSQNIISLTAL